MDTDIETIKHINTVRNYLTLVVVDLIERSNKHDLSKLEEPERSVFTVMTDKLASSTYGSDEYKRFLEEMKPALEHHYANNTHHPEHFKDGIRGMTLLDLVEMLCDWKAATLRHKNGNLPNSIEINQQRFGYSDELKQILINTAIELKLF